MGKQSRLKKERRLRIAQDKSLVMEDDNRIHTPFITPVIDFPGYQDKLTAEFQKAIKESPAWKKMVKEFGKDQAEVLLKQCKAEAE